MHTQLPTTNIRWLTVLLHLTVNLVLLAAVYVLLFKFWFPPPFFSASGGWQGFKLIAVMILLPGPLLSLVVASPNKRHRVLARDIGIIVLVQGLALVWSGYALYAQRPVAAVFWESEFYSVTDGELAEHGYSITDLDRFGHDLPVWVYRPKPASAEGLNKMLEQVTEQHVPPHHQIASFLPYRDHFSDLSWHGLDIAEIINANRGMKEELDEVLAKHGSNANDYEYLALKAKYRNVVVAFTKNGERVGYLYAPYLQNP